MSGFLLDVNLLIALFWPAHVHHKAAHAWFAAKSRRGWATTPLTQAAFIRIVSNPAFSKDAVAPSDAVNLLAHNLKHRHHRFWADDLDYDAAVAPLRPRLVGHRQVTDAYLLGVALHRGGRLATFDGGVSSLAGADGAAAQLVELIAHEVDND